MLPCVWFLSYTLQVWCFPILENLAFIFSSLAAPILPFLNKLLEISPHFVSPVPQLLLLPTKSEFHPYHSTKTALAKVTSGFLTVKLLSDIFSPELTYLCDMWSVSVTPPWNFCDFVGISCLLMLFSCLLWPLFIWPVLKYWYAPRFCPGLCCSAFLPWLPSVHFSVRRALDRDQ